ncbi:inositol monophosphatase family protein [Staphylococcus muscae]|uniref:Inositol monophosphatase n=1 Tax=Staphylococcus muscae TaxID=1294 RepID=A0A240C7D6_9STAP|nr:inositol monophosphatase family protein [Staphylococcus muscae]PNZ02607.1 inositol monophosphatase family protein [Staphylococcus muscae]GGA86943.1 inositol monophosphatase [Staphylococcus muscae]SNW04001.1 inositol monophosphatase family protein [Staphylococcus muscae]
MVEVEQLKMIDKQVMQWLDRVRRTLPSMIEDMDTQTKANRFDLVTNVDKAIEQSFEQMLTMHFPNHQLYGEEAHHNTEKLREGFTWVIDPIDGTANLVKQQDDFCLILALFHNGQPVLSYIDDFSRQKRFQAIKGQGVYLNDVPLSPPSERPLKESLISFNNKVLNDETMHDLLEVSFGYRLIGACGLDSAKVFTGQFGAHIHTNAKPWDIGAQFLFAEMLGLKMTNFHQEPIDFIHGGPFIISNAGCYDETLKILLQKGGYQKL